MGRGIGVRPSGSRTDGLFLDYSFDLFTQNDNGVERTFGDGTFVDAAEKFNLNIIASRFDFDNDIDPVENTESDPIGGGSEGDRFPVPTIESLDFTAKTETINGTDYITYSLSDPELAEFGINRFIFALDAEDGDTLPNGEALDLNSATTDLEYIIENDLLNGDGIFVDAQLEDGSTQIIESESGQFDISLDDIPETEDTSEISIPEIDVPEISIPEIEEGNEPTDNILIEAEDLNLDTYLVEDFGQFGLGGTGISLLDASGDTGTASFQASDFGLSGRYDLELSYFDEADGEAQIEILQNDNVLQSITLNENTFINAPSELNRRTLTIEDLDIAATDNIAIRGTADSGEWARIDNLSFTNTESDAFIVNEQQI